MGRALIVSAGASSNEYLCARLTELGYTRPLIVPSGAEARRRMLESDFELIVVNAPLPDEFGHDLCATAVEKTKCCLIAERGMSEAEAHRYIEKNAMDTRRDRAEIAQEILDSYDPSGV